MNPSLGPLAAFGGKSMFIRTEFDNIRESLIALGEAIARWNDALGARFFMHQGTGGAVFRFHERVSGEYPFNFTDSDTGGQAGGMAVVRGPQGNVFARPGPIDEADLYLNVDPKVRGANVAIRQQSLHATMVHDWAHEIGHALGLAHPPADDRDSIMTYGPNSIARFGPSPDDIQTIATANGIDRMDVRLEELEGVEHVTFASWYDRHGYAGRVNHGYGWVKGLAGNPELLMVPGELYRVEVDQDCQLSFGRWSVDLKKEYPGGLRPAFVYK